MTLSDGNLFRTFAIVESNKKVAKCIIALADEEGKILDYIDLTIRGLEVNQIFLDEDAEGAFVY